MTRLDSPQSEGLRRSQAEVALFWGRLLCGLIVLGMVGVLGRVVQIKLRPHEQLAAVTSTSVSVKKQLARRGNLIDRAGRIIATSSVGHRLFIDPQDVDDPGTIAVDVAHALGVDPVAIDMKIAARPDSRYVVVSQLLEDWQVDAVQNAGLAGVGLEPRLVRHYPQGEIASNVVGMVGFEHTGLGGFEHAFDRVLSPTPGRLEYLRDAKRRALWINPDDYEPAADGHDLRLSIDLVIQDFVEKRLREQVLATNAGGGRVVVMDCNTGEILAMCDVLNQREGWDEVTDDPKRAVHPSLGRNRCVTDPYEPGSTFKPFVWAIATALGHAHPDEELETPLHTGYRTERGRLIRDTHYYGPVSWKKTLVKSLNSGMAIVAERMAHREMQDVINRFGFGRKTHVGIPGETAGLVTMPEKWTHYTQTSVCMGHEIAVTPVQMVRAFSVFARDGTMPTPRITAATRQPGEYHAVHRVLPADVVKTTREAMRDVMTDGTGRASQSERYQLFGKSGTPQLPKKEGGGYHEDRYVPSFIAAAPFDEPQIVVLCVIDDPDKTTGEVYGDGHYGGKVAGPVVRDIIDAALEYLGVPPDKPQAEDADQVAQGIVPLPAQL